MSSHLKIQKILVDKVSNTGTLEGKKVACKTFWDKSDCVIIFFRRFGCKFCRLDALELSENLKPILEKNNIRFIGIGFDSRFVQSFVKDGYFKGELYIDMDKSCYLALKYPIFSWFALIKNLLSIKWKKRLDTATSKGIKGDFKGDGFQNGGALIVDKNGKLLFEYRQEDPAEQINTDVILNVLNLKRD